MAVNGSIVWKGLGFSANGPYDAAFALGKGGMEVSTSELLRRELRECVRC